MKSISFPFLLVIFNRLRHERPSDDSCGQAQRKPKTNVMMDMCHLVSPVNKLNNSCNSSSEKDMTDLVKDNFAHILHLGNLMSMVSLESFWSVLKFKPTVCNFCVATGLIKNVSFKTQFDYVVKFSVGIVHGSCCLHCLTTKIKLMWFRQKCLWICFNVLFTVYLHICVDFQLLTRWPSPES